MANLSDFDYISDTIQNHLDESLEAGAEGIKTLVGNPDTVQYKFTGNKLNPRTFVIPGKYATSCNEVGAHKQDNNRLIFSSEDNVIFRLYITEMSNLDDPKYQNRFVRLLRQLSEHQTLHIYMGSEVCGGYPSFSFGNMVDAIQRAQCNVVTHINGRAGTIETYLWLFGHERHISEFGVLHFMGLESWLKWGPEWRPYFETFLDKAIGLKLLTEEEKSDLLTSNRPYRLTYSDVISRINTPVNDDE